MPPGSSGWSHAFSIAVATINISGTRFIVINVDDGGKR
jgi:hypothetical protein